MKDYLSKLRDRRQSHPISQADFTAWRENIITQQLYEDVELFLIECAEEMRALSADTAGLQLGKYDGVRLASDFVFDWQPEELEVINND